MRKSFFPVFNYILVLIVFLAQLGQANAMETTCERFYSTSISRTIFQRIKIASSNYIDEVKRTRGASLVVRDPKDPTIYPLPLFANPASGRGILDRIDRVVQKIPNMITQRFASQPLDFRPGRWFIDNAIQRPVRSLSQKIFNKTKEVSALMIFLASVGTSVLTMDYIDAKFDRAIEAKQHLSVQRKSAEYETLLATDYRFTSLKDVFSKLYLTKEDQTSLTYQWNEMIRQFYNYVDVVYMKEKSSDPNKANINLLNQPTFGKILFSDISHLAKNGVPPNVVGFEYQSHFTSKLNLDQINKLVELRLDMLSKMDLASHIVFNTEVYRSLKNDPILKSVIAEIENDKFVLVLKDLHQQGKIDAPKLRFLIQENLYWKNAISQWNVVGLIRLKKIEDVYTQEALTIEDIQQETLDDISSHIQ